jgi:hypothetical protein
MVKRIPCRVVRTEPLVKSINALDQTSRSNHFRCKFGEFSFHSKSTKDTFIYTRILELTSISIKDSLAGQIVDFYV